jgi:ubiquinone/menaquinone biosynthesis C-methylase UbiE
MASDGLSVEVLRASRQQFWDEHFTAALLEHIPLDARRLVDVGCGLAHAARVLLPARPSLSYLGVDHDLARLRLAAEDIAVLGSRVQLACASAPHLPVAKGTADVVLFTMTLQHLASPGDTLAEARRALSATGRLVALEPDNLGQRFYFDGVLAETTAAFATLTERCRANRAPTDLAIGPRVARLVTDAGMRVVSRRVIAVHSDAEQTAALCAARLEQSVGVVASAGGIAITAPEVAACLGAIEREIGRGPATGFASIVVPAFLIVARH